MRVERMWCTSVLVFAITLVGGNAASAQNYSGDARMVAMGGVGSNANIAASMVQPAQTYGVIPVPLGLIQAYQNRKQFMPDDDQFDPVGAIAFGSSPLHYTLGRNSDVSDNPERRFVRDLVNGQLNRDLSTYRGFQMPEQLTAEGLASGVFGKTIKFAKRDSGAFQGVFIGAGPYLAFGTTLGVDRRLVELLGSETPLYFPNTSFQVVDDGAVQLAMSIAVGYRARFALPGQTGSAGDSVSRDGVYVAANYRYLKGFNYLQPATTVRFDTGAQGLVTINPLTSPLTIDALEASSGTGRAVDIGVEIVRGRIHGGVGVNGIGNQIEWTDFSRRRFTLTSLVQGLDFVEQVLAPTVTNQTVKLPVVTSADLGFDGAGWAVATSVMNGFNGKSFHGGVERQLGPLALRAGARYSRERWDPTYGFGIGRRVGLDVGVFSTRSNLQNKRETAIAVSVRLGQAQ
jgi:hypothetical protein